MDPVLVMMAIWAACVIGLISMIIWNVGEFELPPWTAKPEPFTPRRPKDKIDGIGVIETWDDPVTLTYLDGPVLMREIDFRPGISLVRGIAFGGQGVLFRESVIRRKGEGWYIQYKYVRTPHDTPAKREARNDYYKELYSSGRTDAYDKMLESA